MAIATLFRLTVGIILALSFLAKTRDVSGFAKTIGEFDLVRGQFARRVAAVAIVVWEGVTAFGLLSGWHLHAAVVSAVALLVSFSLVTARSVLRGSQADCGCLGRRVALRMGWISVGANIFLASGLLVQIAEDSILAPLARTQAHAPLATSLVLVLCALLCAAVYWLSPYARSVSELVDSALSTHAILELKT